MLAACYATPMNIKDVIATVNRMQVEGVIERYAIGGAVAATFYLEPVSTLDVDIFVTFRAEPGSLLISPQPIFDYLTAHPEDGAIFNGGMAAFSELENPLIAAAYDFPAGARVVDVGGGRGGFIAAVMRAHPSVRGVLYDLPEVVRDAGYLRAAGVVERCEILGGSFFESVPRAADVYVVKRILHDWSDETCIQILANVRRAMHAGGRVLAIDAVLAPRGMPDMNKVSDLLMMVVCPGRERTEHEFRDLFAAAGLRLTRVVPTPSSLSIVEGVTA